MASKQDPFIIIAGGGTGGHIFPALSVAQELRRQHSAVRIRWIGTSRSREEELCAANSIPIQLVRVSGLSRRLSVTQIKAAGQFFAETGRLALDFRRQRPDAAVAFGGYVCAPVLAAAKLAGVPYYIQEQNTVLGLTNRIFARGARRLFLGFPPSGEARAAAPFEVTGTPVRLVNKDFRSFAYPAGLDPSRTTVLLCGGSQGALTMNRCCVDPVKRWLGLGLQVVWQTGSAGLQEIADALRGYPQAFLFESVPDLYPYYSIARVVVGRAGASTLSEAAYFGLPCVCIPLPWSAGDHQWKNAGWVEAQGWGFRIRQSDTAGAEVDRAVQTILGNPALAEKMSRKALDCAPVNAATTIAQRILEPLL